MFHKAAWGSLVLGGVLALGGCASAPPPAVNAPTPTAATTTSAAAPAVSRKTRYPRIAKVEKVAALEDTRAAAGQELWVVHFETPIERPDNEDLRQSFLVDAKGRKRPPLKMLGKLQTHPAKDPGFVFLEFQLEGLAYALPKGATPQFFQFGQEAPVKLPL